MPRAVCMMQQNQNCPDITVTCGCRNKRELAVSDGARCLGSKRSGPGSLGPAAHVKMPSVYPKDQGKYRLPLGGPPQLSTSVLLNGKERKNILCTPVQYSAMYDITSVAPNMRY